MAAKRVARPFEYPMDEEDRAAFSQDTLVDDRNADGQTCRLMYFSTRFREWLDTLRQQYPELQETQQDGKIILQSKEGIITLDPSVDILVHDRELRHKFEHDFPQMAQAVRPGIVSIGNGARPFTYPEGLNDNERVRHRKGMLHDNEDTLFYDKRNDKKYNLVFFSKHVLQWLDKMKGMYTELQEKTQDNMIILKNGTQPGTITLYPKVKVVVEGKLMKRFERDFPQMRQTAPSVDLSAAMEGLTLKNKEEHPDEPEGEGTLDTPPNPPTEEKECLMNKERN